MSWTATCGYCEHEEQGEEMLILSETMFSHQSEEHPDLPASVSWQFEGGNSTEVLPPPPAPGSES